MGTRRPDKIQLVTDAGSFDRWTRLSVLNDILGQAEATFETGDDSSWDDLARALAIGTEVRVLLNGKLRLKGRAEILDGPCTPEGGTTVLVTVRTKMADARYASARPRIITNATTFKDFVLACYKEVGITESDFEWSAMADVALMTGKRKSGGTITNFEPLKPDQAKVNPPETIFAAVDKHLRRFRALHWDGANGKIVVGIPDDTQEPQYVLNARKGAGAAQGNNLTSCRWVQDWSEVAREVWLLGATPGKDMAKMPVKGSAIDQDVLDVFAKTGHFNRLVIIPRQQAEDLQTANQHALRELSQRRQRKNGWELGVDGWTYWNGSEQIPYAPNTTADVNADALGGAHGRHLILRVQLECSVDAGCTSRLTVVAPGIWSL